MSCGFCRTTPVNPCPVCSPQTVTPKAIRKPKAIGRVVNVPLRTPGVDRAAFDRKALYDAEHAARVDAARSAVLPPIVAQAPAQPAAHRVAGVCCNDCGDVYPAARAIPSGMVRLASGHLVCESCAAKRAAIVRPTPQGAVIDWNAAAQFTLSILNRRKLPEVAGVRVDSTLPPVARGDWAGLGRAVDAGYLTEKQAIALAASWRAGVAS